MPDQYRCQACGEPMGMPGMWGSTRDLHTPAVCEDCHVKGARTTTPCPQCEQLRARLESAEAESRQAFEDHQEVCAVVINLRALLRESAAEIRPILDMNTRDLGGILCGAGGGHRQWLMEKAISHVLLLLRRAEAEAGEEKDDVCLE